MIGGLPLGIVAALTANRILAADTLPDTFPAVTEAIQKAVSQEEIAGAVTLVVTRDKVLHLAATGMADRAAKEPMHTDSLFWIASMTKPITAAAVLMLQDQGKLSLDDPISKYLPEFSSLKTADGQPAVVTIRHLLTHTSGMSEITGEQARGVKTLAQAIPLYAAQPLKFAPGSKWVYCQSGINTAGRIVEVVSGQTFPQFLEQHLFRPLGMKDTTFYLSAAQLLRLVKSYRRTDAGQLEAAAVGFLNGTEPTSHDRFPAANGGLFSSAPDYARFCQLLLNRGIVGKKRLLSEKAIDLMSHIQTGELKTGFTDGNGWGIGCCVVREPQGITAMLSPGTFGHGGAFGTQAWVDPVKGVAYLLMVQRANFPNSDASEVRRDFQQAASDALHRR